MTIENRDLKPGTTLVARYKKQDYKAEVVQTDDGVRYRLNGSDYKSPSAAGSAIMDGNACNGWRFWSIPGENGATEKPASKPGKKQQPATSFASRRRSDEAKTERADRPKKGAHFEQLEDGRFFCSVCMDAFDAPKGVTPLGCPKGHAPA